MDGYEAVRHPKAGDVGRRTPVIAVTAGVLRGEGAQARAAGFDAFVRKPFQFDVFFSVLQRALGVATETLAAQLAAFDLAAAHATVRALSGEHGGGGPQA